MKTILLAVFLVAVSVVPVHAQSEFNRAFDSGARLFLEAERLRMERDSTTTDRTYETANRIYEGDKKRILQRVV
jgi:hypothetical protein